MGKSSRRKRQGSIYIAEPLESRQLLTGVTLIAHGFGANTSGWVSRMADVIAARPDADIDPIRYTVTVTDPGHDGGPLNVTSSWDSGASMTSSALTNPEIIILLDWSDMAGSFPTGGYHRGTIDIAAAVAERLVQPGFLTGIGGSAITEWPMHLIGHSRGATLVGELARDLGMRGVWVDQVTSLDPHPVDAVNEPPAPIDLHWGDATPIGWENVNFWDNYWRTEGPTSFDFTGQSVPGAYNIQLSEAVLGQGGSGLEHSDVHTWYHGTIDTSATANDGDVPVPTTWYNGFMGPRDQTGYEFSRIVGGTRPATGVGTQFNGTAIRYPVPHTGSQWPNIDQLNLEYDQDPTQTFTKDDRVFVSYRFQDSDSGATISWWADNDANPVDGGTNVFLGSQSVSKRSFVDAGSFNFPATLATGTWYIYAQISDQLGRGRYGFLREPLNIVDPPQVTEEITGQTVNGFVPKGGGQSYYVHANAGDVIMATMTNTGGELYYEPWMGLYAPDGTAISGDWDFITAAVGTSSAPQTGDYRIDTRDLSNDASGGYALTIVHLPATQDGGGDGGPLVSGVTRSANMAVGDIDLFTFHARKGESMSIAVARTSGSTSFSPWIGLYAPNGAALDGRWDYLGTGAGRVNAPQDGTYFVIIRDVYDDASGGYDITLEKLGGAQDGSGDSGPVRSGQTVHASMTLGDLDVYTITAGKGQTITAAMTKTSGDAAFNPWVGVYAPDGVLLDGRWDYVGTGASRLTAPQDGTYYILAEDFQNDGTGNYDLTVAVLPAEQDSGGDGGPIVSGQTRSGSMDPGDIDVFTFDAHLGDSISAVITRTSGTANPYLALYAPNGAILDGRWDSVGTGVSELSVTQEGTYYLVAYDYGVDQTGTYNITLAKLGGAQDSGGDAGPISSGQTRSGSITPGDIDIYTFDAHAGESIAVVFTKTSDDGAFNPSLALYGPDGTLLDGRWDYAGTGVGKNNVALDGTYYIVAYDYGAESGGNYSISLAKLDGPQQSGGDGGNIQSGQTRSASITLGDLDVFTFAAGAGQKISATMTETAGDALFNPSLALYGPTGNLLSAHFDVTTTGVLVNAAPQSGVYYLVAYDYGAEGSGDYTLSLTITGGTPPTLNSILSAAEDLLFLRRNPLDLNLLDGWLNSIPLGAGTPTLSQSISGLTSLNLLGGDDQVILDFGNGAPLAPGSTIDGGAGGDSMRVIGTPGTDTVTFDPTHLIFGGSLNLANVETRAYDGQGGGDAVTVNGAQVDFDSTQSLDSLTVGGGASPRLTSGGSKLLRANSLAIDGTSRLDLSDNALVLDYSGLSPIATLAQQIKTGRNGGTWDGPGIITTASDAQGPAALMTLGVAEASQALGITAGQTAVWNGQTVDDSSVLALHTWAGDANLDRKVNIDDYFHIDVGFANHLTGWFNGDFNHSGGSPDGDDYLLIDMAFLSQSLIPGGPAAAGASAMPLPTASATRPVSPFSVQPIDSGAQDPDESAADLWGAAADLLG